MNGLGGNDMLVWCGPVRTAGAVLGAACEGGFGDGDVVTDS